MRSTHTSNRFSLDMSREINEHRVLACLWHRPELFQKDLVRETGLTGGTIHHILRDLTDRRWVKQVGVERTSRGRRPCIYRLDSTGHAIVAVEVAADHLRVAVLDLRGRMLYQHREALKRPIAAEELTGNIAQLVRCVIGKTNIRTAAVLGVGVSIDGIVDSHAGVCLHSLHLDIKNAPIVGPLEHRLNKPVYVDNDVRSMARAEQWFGVAREASQVVVVEVDEGIGSAMLINKAVDHGAHHQAGELGHTIIWPRGPMCACGNRGCLEAISSGPAMVQAVLHRLARGQKSTLNQRLQQIASPQAVRHIFAASGQGDPVAKAVLKQAVGYLAIALANLINLHDPEVLVLTGYVVDASDGQLIRQLRRLVPRFVVNSASRQIHLETSTLGTDATLLGASALVYQQYFNLTLANMKR